MATATLDVGPLGLENPAGTDGFEFVEYAAPDAELLRALFTRMGFPAVARHRRKNVTLHRQGEINFIINSEPGSFAEQFAADHGPCACAMAFRVKDAKAAHARAIELGATNVDSDVAEGELDIPAIEGIGGSRLYLRRSLRRQGLDLRRRFRLLPAGRAAGLAEPRFEAHLHRPPDPQCESRPDGPLGRVLRAALQLPRDPLFRHRGEGQTGLFSKAMTTPCGKIRIPLNESQDDKSQIEEFLREYKGEGIQHIALGTRRHLRDGRYPARPRHSLPGHARHLLRAGRRAREGPWRADRRTGKAPHPGRRRADRGPGPAAADLHPERDRPDLLRNHPAQGQRGLRRRQFQGAVRDASSSTRSRASCEVMHKHPYRPSEVEGP